MSTFPGSPKLIKGGLVLLDGATGAVKRAIALQYNPDSLTRSYQVQGVGEGQAGLKQRFGESRVDIMAYGRTPWS